MENKAMAQVEYRLAEWAAWTLRIYADALGYPRKTIEARLITEGAILIKSTAPHQIFLNESAEEMDQAISELNRYYPDLGQVIRMYYFGQGNIKARCKNYSVPHSTFRHKLTLAKHWLSGRLTQ